MIKDYKDMVNRSTGNVYTKPNPFGHVKKIITRNYLILLILFIIFCLIIVSIQKDKIEIYVTRYGRIADEFTGEGLFVRDEEVVYAPFAGRVSMLVKNKEKVQYGRALLELEGGEGKRTFYAHRAGTISYQVDGIENNLKPEMLENFQQDFHNFRGKSIKISDGDRVNAGRPLYKIVDNFALYLLVEAPANQVFRYEVGDKVWVSFNDLTIVGWVIKIYELKNLFVIEMERFPNEVIDLRRLKVKVLTDAYWGVYIPRKAIVKKDDVPGVYRIYEGKVYFTPISEIGGNDEYVVVSGITRGVEILIDPQKDLAKFEKSKNE